MNVRREHVSVSNCGRNTKQTLMVQFIFKNLPDMAQHKNPSVHVSKHALHVLHHCTRSTQVHHLKHQRKKETTVSVCSGRRLSVRPGLLGAVSFLRLCPLEPLLLQSLLLLLHVCCHIVKAHFVQVLEASAGPCGGWRRKNKVDE